MHRKEGRKFTAVNRMRFLLGGLRGDSRVRAAIQPRAVPEVAGQANVGQRLFREIGADVIEKRADQTADVVGATKTELVSAGCKTATG